MTLGILIVLGVVGLAAGLVYRANKLGDKGETQPSVPSAAISESAALETLNLPLPRGAKIIQTTLEGSMILIRWAEADSSENIWIVDLNTGRVVRRIDVTLSE